MKIFTIHINGTIRPVLYINGILDVKEEKFQIYNGSKLVFDSTIRNSKCTFSIDEINGQFAFNLVSRIGINARNIKVVQRIQNETKTLATLKESFFIAFWRRLGFLKRYDENQIEKQYKRWIKQEKSNEVYTNEIEDGPLLSIVIPTYNVEKEYLLECVDSVLKQRYQKFEVCIVDDASTNQETLSTLEYISKLDDRIHIEYRKTNGHISTSSNDGIKMANGDFIGFLDHDDVLHQNALYYIALEIYKNNSIDILYTDNDKLSVNRKRCQPSFKPAWSPNLLLSFNYINHLLFVRKSLLNKVGGFRVGFEGAQDYDLLLRMTEITQRIVHIPKVLYHWRMIESSTANESSAKGYADEKGRLALSESLNRRSIQFSGVNSVFNTIYQVQYSKNSNPKISIIIPTKDKINLLKNCIDSIYSKSTYTNYEVIVVDNNSEENATFEFLEKYSKEKENFKFIRIESEFNYSYLNNTAAKNSSGDYLVLLNNDTVIITEDWLERLLFHAVQSEVGCVGAKLLYENNTVQHGGIVLGIGGIAGHAFINYSNNSKGYMFRLTVPSNISGVTAACLMVNKNKYFEVGGLEETLKVAFNDVDFNLKMLEKGYFNVFTPDVLLYHYESKSRGYEDTQEKQMRFISEMNYMKNRWGKILTNDRFYNPNLSLKNLYSLSIEK